MQAFDISVSLFLLGDPIEIVQIGLERILLKSHNFARNTNFSIWSFTKA